MKRTFLDLLFHEKSEEMHILIWLKLKSKKVSKWFADVSEATEYAEAQGEKADVYFGIGLSPKAKAENQRVEANEVVAIPGLWVDLDYQSSAHKKKNLPPTEADCLVLINRMPCKPSITIHSGHGFQAYWLFHQLAIIETGEQRLYYAELNERWQRRMKALASEDGYDVDSTFDLARVFRVPETLNHKEKETVPVKVVKYLKNRYDAEQLEAMLEELEDTPTVDASQDKLNEKKQTAAEIGELDLNPNADVNLTKFEALCQIEPRFRQSWERKRRDMSDTSASSYDLSLATFAAIAGWQDQEIANLIIASRRKHGDDLKLRQKYYKDTIAHARTSAGKQQRAQHAIVAPISEDVAENLEHVSESLGIHIERAVKFDAEPPLFVLYLAGGKQIELKGEVFTSQTAFRTAVINAVTKLIPHYPPRQWTEIITKLLASFEHQELGSDSSLLGATSHYLYKYLKAQFKPEMLDESQHDRAKRGKPAIIAGAVCVDVDAFRRYVVSEFGDNILKTVLQTRLKRLGCHGEKKSIRPSNENATSKYLWVIAPEFLKANDLELEKKANANEKPR